MARQLRGRVLRPGQPGYAAASLPYNHRYADIRPEGVALCAGAADVAAAVLWARRYGLPFAARSGGHSYGGYSASRGLVISLAPLRSVRVDRRELTITAGAGARNRDLYAALPGTGVAVPSGRCPTVGISGLLLGGGFGFSSRHLGLTCDQLLETEVVTASGRIVRATRACHPDLFWACQGGGGGNFGINTEYTLRATPVGDVSVYQLEWAWPQARAALDAVLTLMSDAPATLSCRVGLEVQRRRPRDRRPAQARGVGHRPVLRPGPGAGRAAGPGAGRGAARGAHDRGPQLRGGPEVPGPQRARGPVRLPVPVPAPGAARRRHRHGDPVGRALAGQQQPRRRRDDLVRLGRADQPGPAGRHRVRAPRAPAS